MNGAILNLVDRHSISPELGRCAWRPLTPLALSIRSVDLCMTTSTPRPGLDDRPDVRPLCLNLRLHVCLVDLYQSAECSTFKLSDVGSSESTPTIDSRRPSSLRKIVGVLSELATLVLRCELGEAVIFCSGTGQRYVDGIILCKIVVSRWP